MGENLKFGVRVSMPENDPFSAPHLLGDSWSNERWFETEQERDQALLSMETQPAYYRKGDLPSVILEKVSR